MGTIYDIAKLSGCSPATVSKVFRGYSEISDKTRTKVLNAANELGYKVKKSSSLKSKSNLIAVIYDDWKGFSHPFFSKVLDSARKTLEKYNYDLLFLRTTPSDNIKEICIEKNIDGILIISTEPRFFNDYKKLFKQFPIVSLNEIFTDEYSVISNNAQGIHKAMEYLIRLGHKNIGLITGEHEQVPGKERFKEYRECLNENGIRFSKNLVQICKFYNYEEGYSIMAKLLQKSKPTAVLVTGDYLCMGAIDYAIKAGYKVPEDISFVGFDDIEYAKLFKPAITTIRQDKEALGEQAVNLLMQLINGKRPNKKRYLIDTELILRESSTICKK